MRSVAPTTVLTDHSVQMSSRGDSDSSRFACVVLAAGAGTRYGGQKYAAILPDGSTFLAAVLRTAAAAGADPIVAVVPTAAVLPDGMRAVTNPDPTAEQIVSLRLGLAQLANSSVSGTLAWPVDYPLVRAETVETLVTVARASPSAIVIPVAHGRRGHPTYFGRAVWPTIMTATKDGARSVIRRHADTVIEVPVDDAGVLADLNTPADLARAVHEATS